VVLATKYVVIVIVAVCALGQAQSAYAQVTPRPVFPAEDMLEKEIVRTQSEQRDVFKTKELNAPVNSFPNIPIESIQSGVNIEAIAQQYRAKIPAVKPDDLFVFASFGMPKASLAVMARDAAKVGAILVFRGFKNNSWKDTAEHIASLQNDGVNAVVNPNAFKAFKITVVPAVVVTKPEAHDQLDAEGCALPAHFARAVGDVTLDYALEYIAKSSPSFRDVSLRYARAVKGTL
jgi:conjugal transfer pilus assembly protein TrbC